jgi:hypothetical protein
LSGSINSVRPFHTKIGDPDVLARQPQLHQQIQAGQRGGAGARRDELDLANGLVHHLQAVEQRCADHDGGAVLIVVEDWDLQALAEAPLDVETIRCLDVLEVDATERRLERGDGVDQAVEILFVDLDVEDVDAGELFEQDALALHHRLGCQRTDVAQAEHGRAVGHHCHQVAAGGETVGIHRVGDDLLARRCDPRRIREREIALVEQLFRGRDRYLTGSRKLVIFKCRAAQLRALGFVAGGHDAPIAGGCGRRL